MHPNYGPHPPHWYGMPANMRVADADRERTIEHLKHAYGEGRLNAEEFEERVESALAGRTRADLEVLLEDLLMPLPGAFTPMPMRPPVPMPMPGMRPTYQGPPMPPPWWINRPPPRRDPQPTYDRVWSAAAHWSGFCAPVIGPWAIRRTVGARSAFVEAHAREALNFQLTFAISLLLAPLVWLVGDGAWLVYVALAMLGLVGGARALGGDVMRYRVSLRMVK